MLAIDSQLLFTCVVSDDLLRNQNHTGHLLAAALKRRKACGVAFECGRHDSGNRTRSAGVAARAVSVLKLNVIVSISMSSRCHK
jgi:hypothetical protein